LADFFSRRLFTSEVKMTDSQRLLAEYLKGSEPAFRELISRYLDLVYSTRFLVRIPSCCSFVL
jgi:hypothetical protein